LSDAVAAAIIGVAGTVLVGVATQFVNGRERTSQSRLNESERRAQREAEERERAQTRREEFLFRALEHFGGKTQERSVGIAIVEAYWAAAPDQVALLVPVLLNQLTYLLAVVDTVERSDAAHERINVDRLVRLLQDIDNLPSFRESYISTLRAIDTKPEKRGLDLSRDPEISARVVRFLSDSRDALTQLDGSPNVRD